MFVIHIFSQETLYILENTFHFLIVLSLLLPLWYLYLGRICPREFPIIFTLINLGKSSLFLGPIDAKLHYPIVLVIIEIIIEALAIYSFVYFTFYKNYIMTILICLIFYPLIGYGLYKINTFRTILYLPTFNIVIHCCLSLCTIETRYWSKKIKNMDGVPLLTNILLIGYFLLMFLDSLDYHRERHYIYLFFSSILGIGVALDQIFLWLKLYRRRIKGEVLTDEKIHLIEEENKNKKQFKDYVLHLF